MTAVVHTQTITLSYASGGSWRVAYNGEVSAPLSPTITASQLKSVLDGFNGIDNVTVTGGSGSFTVTFGGTQSTTNMQQIFGDAANASNGSTVRTITTAYDAASQITFISDPSSTINLTLDNLGRATTIAQSVNGLTPTVTLNQSFDAMNNRTELKATIASTLDFKNTYQYDQLQRLTDFLQQGQSGGNTVLAKHVTFAYNALSQRTQIARYQSTGTNNAVATTDFTYDSANRLSGIAHKQGSTNLNTYAYSYDPLSRIASIVSTLEGTDTYSYDQTSQLVGATHTSQSNETYGFDANGNQNTTSFTTGTTNQTTAGLGFTYTFDDEGNRTSKTETATGKVEEYTWDYRNRLTKVVFRNSSGGAIIKQVDYEYDPYNRLVHRTFDADGAGSGAATDQFWVYDEGINAVLQFDGSTASNLSHRYLWSNNVDELLADEQVAGSNTLWGLADHLGSLRDIADLNEGTGITSITNHRTFNSFGKLISETNAAVDMLFAFTGKQYDEATALQHNLYRWYDPALGQWLSEDPLSFAAGDSNLVRYVSNTPNNKLDCMGLDENEYSDRMQTYRRNQAIQCHQSDAQNSPFSYSDYKTFMSTLNSWLQDEAERRQNSQSETMKEIEVRVRAAIADSRRNSHLSIPENVWYSVAWGNGNQGPCYEFAERAQQEIEAKTEAFVREHAYICVRRVEWHFGWRPWRPASGHHGIRLDIYDADGNLYKSLYFDNGWLGGSDGVFENDEIPSDYSSPNDAPADKTIFPPWKF